MEQGGERDKVRFMVLERGPSAFLQGLKHLVRSLFWEESSTQGLAKLAAIRISERVAMLENLKRLLATVVGEVSSVTRFI